MSVWPIPGKISRMDPGPVEVGEMLMSVNVAMTTVSLGARHLPGQVGFRTEIFAIGDVHGQAAVLRGVLCEISSRPKAPGRERILVFLGDLIDRGPDSIGAVSVVLAAGPTIGADRVMMLPGNHELEMVDVLDGGDPALWLQNGGRTVMDEVDPDWRSRPWDEVLADLRTAFPSDWTAGIRSAPSHLTSGNLLFVHAGVDPRFRRWIYRPSRLVHERRSVTWTISPNSPLGETL